MITMLTFMFITALMGLTLHRTHLLSTLLCLESMMLIVFLTFSLWSSQFSLISMMAPLVILTFSACETGLGLSLMIATARSQNTDNLKTLNLLRC